MEYRVEKDSMGDVRVPADRYWGPQTQRSIGNFRIGPSGSMPVQVIRAFGYQKKASAIANTELGVLDEEKMAAIVRVCDEIIAGELDDHFPLVIWQTGSGTQTNMNVNEVISNRAHVLSGRTLGDGRATLNPNDDVNRSQSSNDTFPTAMHIAAYRMLAATTLPGLRELRTALADSAFRFAGVVKIGRTHWMDAVPVTFGQELSGYVSQIDHAVAAIGHALPHLAELALGGTAVGTGLNAPKGYAEKAVGIIAALTGLPFVPAPNKFEALASNDALVEAHGALRQAAVSMMKIACDLRVMASGPRCGIGELILPANEPGSSIMPGKVNPTQVEALTMVCAQVMGNDVTIAVAGSNGQFELNVFKPVMIAAFLQSAGLLGDACFSFARNCVAGMEPNRARMKEFVGKSLMLLTSLTPHLGYDRTAEIAHLALKEGLTIRQAALASGYLTEVDFDRWVDPASMTGLPAEPEGFSS
jgi:fumarate hydratase class II